MNHYPQLWAGMCEMGAAVPHDFEFWLLSCAHPVQAPEWVVLLQAKQTSPAGKHFEQCFRVICL
eukprot:1158484-Pelagomonas_calceolata.AAC.3